MTHQQLILSCYSLDDKVDQLDTATDTFEDFDHLFKHGHFDEDEENIDKEVNARIREAADKLDKEDDDQRSVRDTLYILQSYFLRLLRVAKTLMRLDGTYSAYAKLIENRRQEVVNHIDNLFREVHGLNEKLDEQ